MQAQTTEKFKTLFRQMDNDDDRIELLSTMLDVLRANIVGVEGDEDAPVARAKATTGRAKGKSQRAKAEKVERAPAKDEKLDAKVAYALRAKNVVLEGNDATFRYAYAGAKGDLVLLRKVDAETGKVVRKRPGVFVLVGEKLRWNPLFRATSSGRITRREGRSE